MSAATVSPAPGGARRPADGSPGGGRSPAEVVIVVLPMVLAGVLSLISLTGRSLGFDEGATVAIVSQHGGALGRAIERDGGNMSGYYLLLHLLVDIFGNGPLVLRLPSVVFAALTPGIVAALALTLWEDRRVAVIASVLCAVDLAFVYWGQTARGYAGMVCFACASMLAFVRLTRALQDGRPVRGAALAYVLSTVAAAYCGFVVLLIVPVQVVVLLGRRRPLTGVGAAIAAIAALCVPLAVLAVRRGSGQLFWVSRPNHQLDTQVLQSLTGSGLQSTFHRSFTTTPGWIGTAVVLLGVIALVAWMQVRDRRTASVRRSGGDRLAGWGTVTVLVWLVLPGSIEFVISLIAQPVFLPRNLLLSDPALALALGLVLADRRLPRLVAGAGIALALLIRIVPLADSYGVSPEPWRQVSSRVLAAARPGDCITFYPEDARNAFRWYVARTDAAARAPRAVLPAVGWGSTRPFVEIYETLSSTQITGLVRGCRRMWLVSSHEGQRSGPPAAVRHRATWLELRTRLQREFGGGPRTTSSWASAIHVELMPGRRLTAAGHAHRR